MKRARFLPLVVAATVVVVAAGACGPAPDVEGRPMPDRTGFIEVADALQPGCGSLDCHGQRTRNLRLYGGRGLRLPGYTSDDATTTPAEYDASYRSLTALEPDALYAVLADGGRDPERLSLIRKARGTERHKGGVQMQVGDPLDRCIVSWLSGVTDVDSCRRVSRARRPPVEDTP
jgi:hypothetical protein